MLFIDPYIDFLNTVKFINDFTKNRGILTPIVDIRKIGELIALAKEDNHYAVGGADEASVFRKLATFMSYFIAERPIATTFPIDKIGERLHRINNHQNIIIALGIAIKSLKGAKVYRKDGQVVVLNNPIKVSAHSFVDIVDALTGVTPQHGMKMIAVLLEQMVYRQNPDCEYQ